MLKLFKVMSVYSLHTTSGGLWRVPLLSEREREREIVIFCVDLAAAVYGKWQIGTTEIESVERKVSSRTKLFMNSKLQAKT